MVHGQCLRTVDGPTPTAISYTSPNVCCPQTTNLLTLSHLSQLLLSVIPLLPSSTTLSPLFKDIFQFVSLSSTCEHVTQSTALQGQPACKYTLF